MKKLRSVIRHPNFKPEEFGGYIGGDFQFCKLFFLGDRSLKETFEEVNLFLEENGYYSLNYNDFKEELTLTWDLVTISAHPCVNETNRHLNLVIKIFDPWDNPVDRVLVDLLRFRKARDWEHFHNSKDLALALSIKASELSKLFLWKGNEEANPEKLKENLAEVFQFGILLMEKHGFDFEEILTAKIKADEKKYPISKAT